MRKEYPERPVVGVGAVVINNNKLLLIKRGSEPNKDMWAIPGGIVEIGERLEDAVMRELEEETGLKGKPLGIINVDEYIEYDDNKKVKYHFILVDFLIETSGTPQPSSDAKEVTYIDINDDMNNIAITPSTQRLIKKLKEKRSNCINIDNELEVAKDNKHKTQ